MNLGCDKGVEIRNINSYIFKKLWFLWVWEKLKSLVIGKGKYINLFTLYSEHKGEMTFCFFELVESMILLDLWTTNIRKERGLIQNMSSFMKKVAVTILYLRPKTHQIDRLTWHWRFKSDYWFFENQTGSFFIRLIYYQFLIGGFRALTSQDIRKSSVLKSRIFVLWNPFKVSLNSYRTSYRKCQVVFVFLF